MGKKHHGQDKGLARSLGNAVDEDSVDEARAILEAMTPSSAKEEALRKVGAGGTLLHLVKSVEMLDLLVSHGSPLEARSAQGETPLLRSARKGHLQLCRRFLEAGAAPIAVSTAKSNLVSLATVYYPRITMKDLASLGFGLGPNYQPSTVSGDNYSGNDSGSSSSSSSSGSGSSSSRLGRSFLPLHEAAKEGCDDAVSDLVQAGGDLTRYCHRGFTPLHWASFCGGRGRTSSSSYSTTVRLLLQLGADVFATTTNGRAETALHLAVSIGSTSSGIPDSSATLKALLEGATRGTHQTPTACSLLEFQDVDGATPLQRATMKGNLSAIYVLLEAGASPAAVTHGGNSVLHSAMLISDSKLLLRTLELLRPSIADSDVVNLQNAEGDTALHLFVKHRKYDPDLAQQVVWHLCALGAQVNLLNKSHQTALGVVASQTKRPFIETLLVAGSRPDPHDENQTDLILTNGLAKAIAAKVPPCLVVWWGRQSTKAELNAALYAVCSRSTPKSFSPSSSIDADHRLYRLTTNQERHAGEETKACESRTAIDIQIVSELLALGAEANYVDASALKTPLHAASERGYSHLVQVLLRSDAEGAGGTDLNLRVEGTAVQLALRSGHEEVAQFLQMFAEKARGVQQDKISKDDSAKSMVASERGKRARSPNWVIRLA